MQNPGMPVSLLVMQLSYYGSCPSICSVWAPNLKTKKNR